MGGTSKKGGNKLLRKIGKIAVGLVLSASIAAIPAAKIWGHDISNKRAEKSAQPLGLLLMEKVSFWGTVSSLKIHAMIELWDMLTPVIADDTEPELVPRYAGINMSGEELWELAGIVYLESANQCHEGQQAVAEVILNRVASPSFPNTVHDVIHEGEGTKVPQFSTVMNLGMAEPLAAQYDAIDAALNGPNILPEDVVFFSRYGENDRVWGKIQDHVFCYEYIWE